MVETLGSTETSRSHANDEDVNVTEGNMSARQATESAQRPVEGIRGGAMLVQNSHVGTHGGELRKGGGVKTLV